MPPNRNKHLLALEVIMKLVFAIAFAAALTISNRIALLVGGSDATSFLIAPSQAVQVVETVLMALCLLAPVSLRWRVALALPALICAAFATHRVLIDGNHGEIADMYGLVPVQRLQLAPRTEGGFQVRETLMRIAITPNDRDDTITILSPPLLGLDRMLLAPIQN